MLACQTVSKCQYTTQAFSSPLTVMFVQTCDCVNAVGDCDVVTGRCNCTAGWTGHRCNTSEFLLISMWKNRAIVLIYRMTCLLTSSLDHPASARNSWKRTNLIIILSSYLCNLSLGHFLTAGRSIFCKVLCHPRQLRRSYSTTADVLQGLKIGVSQLGTLGI